MNTIHAVQTKARTVVMCASTLQKKIGDVGSNVSFTPLTTQPVREDKNLFVLMIWEKLPSRLKTGYVNPFASTDIRRVLQTLTAMQVSGKGFL
jgi:hypothetical protein